MPDFDFKILSPYEFECLTRDLLQASENLRVESFAEGRDGGIDLRFAYDGTKKCIVQCKRYKEWRELKTSLKKEVEKVKILNPDRYIISTSVDLTSKNKYDIMELFLPYIKDSEKDILGKSDLNNLLGLYPKIIIQYNKLWLGSTEVLNLIIHKNVINWSEFEIDIIKTEISKYVHNVSFTNAEKILQDNRYVIISGIPGIGKTTLARMLVYNYLANGYDEFIYVVDDLDNACKMFDENKKQVFFFDDFLGATSLDVMKSTSFENKLLSFIKNVKKSSNTLFIMTTREYILSEAKNYYEKIDLNNIEIAKCIIDLSDYTELVRAQILYNHLVEAKLPKKYIKTILDNNNYMSIIEHGNFNPRIIEAFINKELWNRISPKNFMTNILEFFDNPLCVWEVAFSNLDTFARYALLVFATFGGNVYYEEWQFAYMHFCKSSHEDLNLVYDDIMWKKTVKILQDCFIKTENTKYKKLFITSFNPSIMDFCISFIRENKRTLSLLLKNVLYPEQLTSIFTDNNNMIHFKSLIMIPNDIDVELYVICQRIMANLASRQFLSINKYRSETNFLFDMHVKFPSFCQNNPGFIEKNYHFQELQDSSIAIFERLELMKIINWDCVSVKPLDILTNIVNDDLSNSIDMDDWNDCIITIKELGLLPEIVKAPTSYFNIEETIRCAYETIINSDDCDKLTDFINNIIDYVPNDFILKERLDEISELKLSLSESEKKTNDQNISSSDETEQNNDSNKIHEMFTSLYDV